MRLRDRLLGETAIGYAALRKHIDVAPMLRARGAKLTPVVAVSVGDLEAARRFIGDGADVIAHCGPLYGDQTLLMLAAQSGNWEMTKRKRSPRSPRRGLILGDCRFFGLF
jgi:hypothetical protein